MSFGKNMRKIRRAKDITQKQLAEKLGVSVPVISSYEREKKEPRIRNAARIADALSCTIDELMNGVK